MISQDIGSEATPETRLPLSGVRVVDFGQYMAGPAVAMILADLGATVVHIDPPGGPFWRTPANATLNRNKTCLEIDLKTQSGLSQALSLIRETDIVIESFRTGVMARLGIDFARLRQDDPTLITVSIPSFASNDGLRSQWRAFESVVAASSGVFTDMGLNRVLMGINPSFSPLPLASAYGTVLAGSAVVLALQAREESGLGDHIEVPLACALMEGLCYNSIQIEALPERYKTQRELEIERRRREGLPMNIGYDELQDLLDPFFRNYRCKDGRMFYVVCPSHIGHVRRCLKTLGLYDELVAEGLPETEDTYQPSSQWQADAAMGVYPLPKHWADHIAERMQAVFLTRTAKEWERIFGRGRFPGAPQRWLQEWLHDDHAETASLVVEVEDPEYGSMMQPGPMFWMQDSGGQMISPQPRETVGFDEALERLTALARNTPQPIGTPQDRGKAQDGWLSNIRILDLSNVIAGPHSVAYLARFGAEVIKLDPTNPQYDAWNTVIYGLSHMRSKRSVLADITQPAGRVILEELIRSVDVVVWNATDQQVAKMALSESELRAINPDVIFCQLDCFSGVNPGPRTNYLGYDDLVQAVTGIMLRFGGSMDTPEEHAHVGTIDVMCGFAAAMGIATALYHQHRTGQAGRVKTSLAALSGLAQIPFFYDYERRGLFDEPSGPMSSGYDALTRFYSTADGILLLSAYGTEMSRFSAVSGLEEIPDTPTEELAASFSRAFLKARAIDWAERLQRAHIGAAVCDNLEAIRASNTQTADGNTGIDRGSYSFSVYEDHPSGHVVTQLDPYAIRPARSRIFSLTAAEKYGASTRGVLVELGYSQESVDALLRAGVVAESWSPEYLPQ